MPGQNNCKKSKLLLTVAASTRLHTEPGQYIKSAVFDEHDLRE